MPVFLNKLQPLAYEEESPNSIKELTDTRAWADTLSQLDTTLRARLWLSLIHISEPTRPY